MRNIAWMELVEFAVRTRDRSFAAKVHAFNAGYERVKNLEYEVIGNLDADVSFDETILNFSWGSSRKIRNLGWQGQFSEKKATARKRIALKDRITFLVNASCFGVRCFEEIGGYVPNKAGGIDWIAVTTARMMGWKTRSFREKSFFHYRQFGYCRTRSLLASTFSYGEKDYYLGGHPVWELFRVAYRIDQEALSVGGHCAGSRVTYLGIPATNEEARLEGTDEIPPPRTDAETQEAILKSLLTFKRSINSQLSKSNQLSSISCDQS